MTHIVIHDDKDGVTQYRQFDDLGNAVSFVETLRNTAGIEGAKLYALDEVAFEVKPYYKVEVVGETTAPVAEAVASAPVAPVVESVEPPEVLPTAEESVFGDAELHDPIETLGTELSSAELSSAELADAELDDVDFAEAGLADLDVEIGAESVPASGGDVRRGLFGR